MTLLSTGTDYDALAAAFRPIFTRIAQGAAEREQQRILPDEPIRWLKEAGFGTLRIPREKGGWGASLPQLSALLIELAQADSNLPQALRGIPLNRQANAREGRQQHMLVEGGLIAKALGKIIDMFGFHPSAGKAGGPAAGQPLAKAIPVIFPHHAGLLGADQGYHIAGG